MFRWLASHTDTMALTLVVWLCSLPLVALFVIPFFELQAAAVAAVILFFFALAVCWGLCGWEVGQRRAGETDREAASVAMPAKPPQSVWAVPAPGRRPPGLGTQISPTVHRPERPAHHLHRARVASRRQAGEPASGSTGPWPGPRVSREASRWGLSGP